MPTVSGRRGVQRCWQRLVWLVNTAAMEPTGLGLDHDEQAILGLSPELTLAILKGLHRDAKELGDDTLIDAMRVYLTQFGSVLAQQGGPVADTTRSPMVTKSRQLPVKQSQSRQASTTEISAPAPAEAAPAERSSTRVTTLSEHIELLDLKTGPR